MVNVEGGWIQAHPPPTSIAGELTTIARMGSGSACRSMYGGFVAWRMGAEADGRDSLGEGRGGGWA